MELRTHPPGRDSTFPAPGHPGAFSHKNHSSPIPMESHQRGCTNGDGRSLREHPLQRGGIRDPRTRQWRLDFDMRHVSNQESEGWRFDARVSCRVTTPWCVFFSVSFNRTCSSLLRERGRRTRAGAPAITHVQEPEAISRDALAREGGRMYPSRRTLPRPGQDGGATHRGPASHAPPPPA